MRPSIHRLKSNHREVKGRWERLTPFLTALAAIVIPIVVAIIGWQVQKVVTSQSTGKDYIGIALGILEKKDLPAEMGSNLGLRK